MRVLGPHSIVSAPLAPLLLGQNGGSLAADGEAVEAGVDGVLAELLLDSEELVVLGNSLRSAWGTSLDDTTTQTNGDVRDGHILSLTGSVADHDGPTVALAELSGLDTLRDGSDLVDPVQAKKQKR